MPRFTLNNGLTDTYGTWRLRDSESAFSTYGTDADAIELRDLLLREFPLDAREANQFYVAGLRYALEWTQGKHAKSVIEAEIQRHSYRSASHDRWDP